MTPLCVRRVHAATPPQRWRINVGRCGRRPLRAGRAWATTRAVRRAGRGLVLVAPRPEKRIPRTLAGARWRCRPRRVATDCSTRRAPATGRTAAVAASCRRCPRRRRPRRASGPLVTGTGDHPAGPRHRTAPHRRSMVAAMGAGAPSRGRHRRHRPRPHHVAIAAAPKRALGSLDIARPSGRPPGTWTTSRCAVGRSSASPGVGGRRMVVRYSRWSVCSQRRRGRRRRDSRRHRRGWPLGCRRAHCRVGPRTWQRAAGDRACHTAGRRGHEGCRGCRMRYDHICASSRLLKPEGSSRRRGPRWPIRARRTPDPMHGAWRRRHRARLAQAALGGPTAADAGAAAADAQRAVGRATVVGHGRPARPADRRGGRSHAAATAAAARRALLRPDLGALELPLQTTRTMLAH